MSDEIFIDLGNASPARKADQENIPFIDLGNASPAKKIDQETNIPFLSSVGDTIVESLARPRYI